MPGKEEAKGEASTPQHLSMRETQKPQAIGAIYSPIMSVFNPEKTMLKANKNKID